MDENTILNQSMDDFYTMVGDMYPLELSAYPSYTALFDMYRRYLFDRVTHIFKWKGLDKLNIPFWEPETILMMRGTCGFSDMLKIKESSDETGPGVYYGHYGGAPTNYKDIKASYSIWDSFDSKVLLCDKEVVVCRNTSKMSSALPLIHKYASMLAHCDLTFNIAMINARAANGSVVAEKQEQKEAYERYRDGLVEGRVGA